MNASENTLMEELLLAIRKKTQDRLPLESLARGMVTRVFDEIPKQRFAKESAQFMKAYQQQFGSEIVNGSQPLLLTENNCQRLLDILQNIRNSIMNTEQFKVAVLDKVPNGAFQQVYHDIGVALLNRVTSEIVANATALQKTQRDNVAVNMEFANRVYKNHDTPREELLEKVKQEFYSDLEGEIYLRLGITKENSNVNDSQFIVDLTSINQKQLAENIASMAKFKQALALNGDTSVDPNFARSNKLLAGVAQDLKASWVHKAEYDALQTAIHAARSNTNAKSGNLTNEQMQQLATNIIDITLKQDKDLGKQLKANNLLSKPKESTSNIFGTLKELVSKNGKVDTKSSAITTAIEKPEPKDALQFQESKKKETKKPVTSGRRSQVIPDRVHKKAERYATMSRSNLLQSQGDLKAALKEAKRSNEDLESKKEEKDDKPLSFRPS